MITFIKYMLLVLLSLASTILNAQQISGSWTGTLDVKTTKIPMTFNLSGENDQLSATWDVPMQGVSEMPLDEASLTGDLLTIKSSKLQLIFEGKWVSDKIEGTYKQAGQEYQLDLVKTIKTLPGDIKLPSSDAELDKLISEDNDSYTYNVEDFFKNPEASAFRLSPNGKYISYLKSNSGKKDLYIKDIKTEKEILVLKQEEDVISGYSWTNNNRIIYLQDKGGNENYHVYGIDIDGKNKIALTPFEGVRAMITANLKSDKDHIIISMNKENPQNFEPYKLNINTGKLIKLYTQEEGKVPVNSFTFDKDGNLRGVTRIVNGVQNSFEYLIDGKFVQLFVDDLGAGIGVLSFNYATDYPHDAYVVNNSNTDKTELQLYDLKKNTIIKSIYKDDTYDMGKLALSKKRNYEIDYISYTGEKQIVVPVSKTYKGWQHRMRKEFGNRQFYVAGRSDDESVLMFVVTSDKIVAEYYIYDIKSNTTRLLYKVLPQLKEEDMATVKPITFKSRDGLVLHGYITLPKAAESGEKVPLIVNPHGGPQWIRDNWSFNPEAQLFASRGYATLHVNFRISGGYGKKFMHAGYKQIGRKVMDDIEDGLQYVISQGWVNENKVAIFGASHGGYAVLRGLQKTPDLYACGVDYVGVSNLNTFMDTFPAYWEPLREFIKASWYDADIPEEQMIMNEISPALHAEKITKPLYVVQGANDPRVNIDEADQMVRNLRSRGVQVPYMVKYDEGHGFAKEKNRLHLYKTMMGFLAKHLKS